MGLRTLAAVTAGLIALATVGCGRRGDPRGFALRDAPEVRVQDAGRTPNGLQWRGDNPPDAQIEWLPLADWHCPSPRTTPYKTPVEPVSEVDGWSQASIPTTGAVAWRIRSGAGSSNWSIAGAAPAAQQIAITAETQQGSLRLSAVHPVTVTVLMQLHDGERWSAPRPLRLPATLGPWAPDTRIELRWTPLIVRNNHRFYPGIWQIWRVLIP